MTAEQERALALLWTGDAANIAIVEALEESGVVDLSEFWAGLQQLYRMQYHYYGEAKKAGARKGDLLALWEQRYSTLNSGQRTVLPAVIGTMQNLKELHCGPSIDLCEELGQLKNLNVLIFSLQEAGEYCGGKLILSKLPNLETLDISVRGEEALPDELFRLRTLKKLKIGLVREGCIDTRIAQMQWLYELNINGGLDTALPEGMRNLRVQRIGLSGFRNLRDVENLPQAINKLNISGAPALLSLPSGLTELSHINIYNSGLLRLPDDIFSSKTTEITICNTQIAALPDRFEEACYIIRLDLQGNELSAVPPSLAKAKKLQKLNLSQNKIQGALDLSELTELTEVVISKNSISELRLAPKCSTVKASINRIERLTGLSEASKVIEASHNRIIELAGEPKLNQLKILKLKRNRLRALPDYFEFGELRMLDLSHNRLEQLPPCWLAKLGYYAYIYLSYNQLEALPPSPKLETHSMIKYITLHRNRLEVLPDWLGKMWLIRYISLNNNRLRSLPELLDWRLIRSLALGNNLLERLPDSIGKCVRLRVLHLHRNCLRSLPEGIGGCTELKILYADHNQIASLPETLGKLRKLRNLRLKYNQLASLPRCLFEMTWLKEINLVGNPLPSETLDELRRALPDTKVFG